VVEISNHATGFRPSPRTNRTAVGCGKDSEVQVMAEKWIQKAVKKPGALHKQLGVPEGKKIPASKLSAAAKKPGKLGQRARLAQTLKGMK